MTVWLTIIVVGAVTYATRLSFILLFSHRQLPERLGRALRFVPAAILTAIIFPELLLPQGTLFLSVNNDRLIAGLVTFLVAWVTKNVMATIVTGMATLLLLGLL
jgi:branched-subunit amino acid transport protein